MYKTLEKATSIRTDIRPQEIYSVRTCYTGVVDLQVVGRLNADMSAGNPGRVSYYDVRAGLQTRTL